MKKQNEYDLKTSSYESSFLIVFLLLSTKILLTTLHNFWIVLIFHELLKSKLFQNENELCF